MKRLLIYIVLSIIFSIGGEASGEMWGGTKFPRGSEYILIAAADASDHAKSLANYQCDNVADEEQFNAAIQSITGGSNLNSGVSGVIVLSEGRFTVSARTLIDRGLRFTGQGGAITEVGLAAGANCNIFEFGPTFDGGSRPLCIIERMKLYGNKDNQTAHPLVVNTGTGTDDTVSVITVPVPLFIAWQNDALAGRLVYLSDTRQEVTNVTIDTGVSDIVVTVPSHGYSNGDDIDIQSVLGIAMTGTPDTGDFANGEYAITKIGADSFSLDGTIAYTTSGTYAGHGYSRYAAADRNCTAGLYKIASNNILTLTLTSNASSGGAMVGLTVEVEQTYQIYQDAGISFVDLRIDDIWFDSFQGGGMSLGRYWNHQINRNTFEHGTGACITLRMDPETPSGSEIQQLHINHNMSMGVPATITNFVKIFGAGSHVSNVHIMGNKIQSITQDLIEIGGSDWFILANKFGVKPDADITYSFITVNTDKIVDDRGRNLIIKNNTFERASSGNYAAHVFKSVGDNDITKLDFSTNHVGGCKASAVYISNDAQLLRAKFNGNTIIQDDGSIFDIARGFIVQIQGNFLTAAAGDYEVRFPISIHELSNLKSFNITGNQLSKGFVGDAEPIFGFPHIIKDNMCSVEGFNKYERKMVALKNESNASRTIGQVVVYGSHDSFSGSEFNTTTTAGDAVVAGITWMPISDDATGYVLQEGFTKYLKVNGLDNIAIGDLLSTFTTAGIAQKAISGEVVFAIALEEYTVDNSSGIIDALLITPREMN